MQENEGFEKLQQLKREIKKKLNVLLAHHHHFNIINPGFKQTGIRK